MNGNPLPRLNRSKRAAALVLACVFLLLLFCNWETDMVADDYQYCFSFADDTRIESVGQIFPSMAAHRYSMNGRVIAHFFAQLFLLLPRGIFRVINALFFALLVFLAATPTGLWEKPNALLLLAVFGCVWVLQPEFGQVFLWLDGSVNYLWCAVFSLLWLRPWARHFLTGQNPTGAALVLYLFFSLAMGSYSENSTVALVAMALLFLLIRLLRKQKIERWMLLSLAAMLIGFVYLMLAPATAANKSAEMKLAVLLGNLVETGRFYLRFWPLLISYALFFVLLKNNDGAKERRALSLVYLFGSLAGHFVLTFALYCAGRSTYIGLILLIAANAVLFVPLWEGGQKKILCALCALCLLVTAYKVFTGVQDIRRTHEQLRFNEELIEECLRNGERDIQVPRPYAQTKYSALEGLGYLNTEDPTDWYNVYMAKYYGADSLIGY